MAKKLTGTDATVDEDTKLPTHNKEDLLAEIREYNTEMTAIETDRKNLNTAAAEARQKLKDCGIETIERSTIDHERKVLQMKGEMRAKVTDARLLAWEALAPGEQPSLGDPADTPGLKSTEKEGGPEAKTPPKKAPAKKKAKAGPTPGKVDHDVDPETGQPVTVPAGTEVH